MRMILLTLCTLSLAVAGDLSGRRAPGFALPDSKGKVYDLADYRGKVVIVEIMQTNCPHCSSFADTLERITKKYAGKVQVLSLANPPDNAQTVAAYVQGHKVTSPVLFDCGQAAYSYMKKPSFDIPYIFLVDQMGMIRNDFGYSPLTKSIFEGTGLDGELDQMLAGVPAKPAAVTVAPKKK
jgi:peroxiredoxin